MFPFAGVAREVVIAILVISVVVLIVVTLVKPASTSINDMLQGSYKYHYKVDLPDGGPSERDLKLVSLVCGKSLGGSNDIKITMRFDAESYKNLTRPLYKGSSESKLDHSGLRIDIDVMADTYYLENGCKRNDDEQTITCDYQVEDTLVPKTWCKSGTYSAKFPVYVSLWDIDKCSAWNDKKTPLAVVSQICIEPGALMGFSKSSKDLGVTW